VPALRDIADVKQQSRSSEQYYLPANQESRPPMWCWGQLRRKIQLPIASGGKRKFTPRGPGGRASGFKTEVLVAGHPELPCSGLEHNSTANKSARRLSPRVSR